MKIRGCISGKLLIILLAALLSGCGADSERSNPGDNGHSASGVILASGSSGMKGYTRDGCITGAVAVSLLKHSSCSGGNVVYIFEGNNVIPDDVGGANAGPVAFAPVGMDAYSENYRYRIAFLREGAYTVALTCQGKEDNPETDDNISFLRTTNVTVLGGREISKHLF